MGFPDYHELIGWPERAQLEVSWKEGRFVSWRFSVLWPLRLTVLELAQPGDDWGKGSPKLPSALLSLNLPSGRSKLP